MREMDCTQTDEIDLAALYLAGRLPSDEAEAFEAHYLGCERCSSALREAGAIRAAFDKPVLAPASPSPRATSGWRDVGTLLAAAATVATFFFGMRQAAEREPIVSDGVLRSATTESMDLAIGKQADGGVALIWPAQPRAHSYRIEIVRSDGVSVLRSETEERHVSLAVADLPPVPEGVTLLAKVEALDAVGQVVAASESRPIPSP